MRILSILTAALVTGALYLLIIERDILFAVAQVETTEDTAEEADPASGETTEAAAPDDDEEGVAVVALRSSAETIDSAVVLRGRTEAARQVEVRSELSGLVISDPQRKGAFVEEGDVLCELDAGTREAQLEEAEGRLEEARARLPEAEARVPAAEASLAEAEARKAEAQSRVSEARARLNEAQINANAATQLSEGGFASDTRVANADAALESARAAVSSAEASLKASDAQIISAEAGVEGAIASVESARAGIQSARAAVASAEQAIEQLTMEAPFAGLMETDAAEIGTLLQPGGLCATVIQLDPIKVVGFVPEAEVGKVETGAHAGARLASGREVSGQVTFLSRSADETTRTFRVEITVDNEDLTISDGQTADILIQASGQSAHLLPQSALTLDDEGTLGVRTVREDDTAGFTPVTIIRDTVEGVWVAGLPETAEIIVVGQEYVTEGTPIRPSFRDEPLESTAGADGPDGDVIVEDLAPETPDEGVDG
ncbi:efflux RND transporter periplasmic adaptor subunit [Histidinibacterium aquaticum]|uniref:Efflux RND transporter periplasmic adaptor subunit n=1 Tax=Histidinibacterium aquaticum TaxID=2613962 RepID=A0A5J5GMK4_9RHOB|nr:efflux RND transporter periplasmic adaptor subunit [Histidinibacterium aquaticum]KAA9009287.1 efflux RND transporter periplasmic adaptor subunit [Histidinibacterium aquaticum]